MKHITHAILYFYHPQPIDNVLGIKHRDEIPLDVLWDFIEDVMHQGWNIMLQQTTYSSTSAEKDTLIVWLDKGTFKQK